MIAAYRSLYTAGWHGITVMAERIIANWDRLAEEDRAFYLPPEGEVPAPAPREEPKEEPKEEVPPAPKEPRPEPKKPEADADGYIKPRTYEQVKALVSMGKKVLLVGPRGTGKTEMAVRIAKELDKQLFMLTSPQMRSDVTGYADANGNEVKSQVTTAITEPGLLLLEEVDRSLPEALIPMNAMIANNLMDVPVRGVVPVNPELRIIATANTNGRGATEEYGTANRLDASTLDRFCVVEVNYEDEISLACIKASGIPPEEAEKVAVFIREFRNSCIKQGLTDYVPSYRGGKTFADILASKDPYIAGMSKGDRTTFAFEVALLKAAVTKDTLATILEGMDKSVRNPYIKSLRDYQAAMKEVF